MKPVHIVFPDSILTRLLIGEEKVVEHSLGVREVARSIPQYGTVPKVCALKGVDMNTCQGRVWDASRSIGDMHTYRGRVWDASS